MRRRLNDRFIRKFYVRRLLSSTGGSCPSEPASDTYTVSVKQAESVAYVGEGIGLV